MSVVAVALVLFVNSVVLGLHTCHCPTCSRINKWFQFSRITHDGSNMTQTWGIENSYTIFNLEYDSLSGPF